MSPLELCAQGEMSSTGIVHDRITIQAPEAIVFRMRGSRSAGEHGDAANWAGFRVLRGRMGHFNFAVSGAAADRPGWPGVSAGLQRDRRCQSRSGA
jgi:hypothetical protein